MLQIQGFYTEERVTVKYKRPIKVCQCHPDLAGTWDDI